MYHKQQKNFVTVISSTVENPYGYGRIVRNEKGDVISIVEERDSNCDQKKIKEINSGAYWFNSKALIDEIGNIHQANTPCIYTSTQPYGKKDRPSPPR